jgi:hypothetical protein
MDARDAYERRAARLALLLTDDAERAGAALASVLRAHRNLARVGETMLERAVVQACRAEGKGAGGIAPTPTDASARALLDAARTQTGQPWEAWILTELEDQPDVLVARAMDSSKHAIAEVHLGPAIAAIRAAVAPADYEASVRALRASLADLRIDSVLAVGRAARDRAIRRSRLVGIGQLALLAVCFGLMVYVLFDLLQASKEERANTARTDAFSNPIPAPGSDDQP